MTKRTNAMIKELECNELASEYRLPRYVLQNPQRYKALLNKAQLKYIHALNISSLNNDRG